MLPKGFLHSQLSTGRGIPVSGTVARLGHPGTAAGWHLQLSHILEKWFFQVQETLPGAPNQSGASPMRDAVLCGCFPQQLRVPTGNRGFPAQIWERGRRTARAGPSTSPGTQDVTRAGFSHLVRTHFQTQHFIFLLFPGSEDGFPPSQGPRSNKLPCSIMGMVNLDLSSCNTSFPARSNSK